MYDRTRLKALGSQNKAIKAAEEELRPELWAEIRAAHLGGVQQKDIIEDTGYTRETVRLASMSEQEREDERVKRRKPAQQQLEANPQLVDQMERTAADPSSRVRRGRPTRQD